MTAEVPENERFSQLPERVEPEDMVAEQDSQPVPDPEFGRDPDRDFLLRNSG